MKKRIGIGSLAFVLYLLGMAWGKTLPSGLCFGDSILATLNIPTWSNNANATGLHYTIFYGLIFWIPSIIVGHKYKNDLFAKLGKWLSLLTAIPIGLIFLFSGLL